MHTNTDHNRPTPVSDGAQDGSSDEDSTEPQVLNRGGWANGDVYLTRIQGRQAVLKTYADKPALIRVLGRYLLNRERRAYLALQGIDGVPDLLDCDRPDSLALEFAAGDRISNHALRDRGERIVEQLTQLIREMHARGVYHLDLRNQGNVLVDDQCRTTVLDFASSMIVRGRNPLSLLVAWLCRRFDEYGLSKWRNRWLDLQREQVVGD